MFFWWLFVLLLLHGAATKTTSAPNKSIPGFLQITPIQITKNYNYCVLKSNVIADKKSDKLTESGNCAGYIYPPLLQLQHGINSKHIEFNKNRLIYKKIVDFDCRKKSPFPALDFRGKRIPRGFKIIPSKGGIIEGGDNSREFYQTAQEASGYNKAFMDAFFRTTPWHHKFVYPRGGIFSGPIRYVFHDVLCVKMIDNWQLNDDFVRAVELLPEEWEPLPFIQFVKSFGTQLATAVCLGGEVMLRSMEYIGRNTDYFEVPGEANFFNNLEPSTLQYVNDALHSLHNAKLNGTMYTNIPFEDSDYEFVESSPIPTRKRKQSTEPLEKWMERVNLFPTITNFINTVSIADIIQTFDVKKAAHVRLAIKLVDVHNLANRALFLIDHIMPNGVLMENDKEVVELLTEESQLLCPNLEIFDWLVKFTTVPLSKW